MYSVRPTALLPLPSVTQQMDITWPCSKAHTFTGEPPFPPPTCEPCHSALFILMPKLMISDTRGLTLCYLYCVLSLLRLLHRQQVTRGLLGILRQLMDRAGRLYVCQNVFELFQIARQKYQARALGHSAESRISTTWQLGKQAIGTAYICSWAVWSVQTDSPGGLGFTQQLEGEAIGRLCGCHPGKAQDRAMHRMCTEWGIATG